MRPPWPVPLILDGSRPCSSMSFRTTGERSIEAPADPPPPELPFAPAGAAFAGAAATSGVGDPVPAGGAGGAAAGGCSDAATAAGSAALVSVPAAVSADAAGTGAAAAGSSRSAAGVCSSVSAGAAAAAGGEAAAAPSPPITARRVPTSTVSPSGTRISESTPAADDGTSESTLSVETSKRGSSWATSSPTCFSQRMMVPSVTVSPSCGIVMSAKVQAPSGECENRLPERLGQRRVRLDELGDLVGRCLPVDGEVSLAELLGDPRPDHVHSEEAPGPAVGQLLGDDLHDPVRLAEDAGTAVAAEGVLLHDDVEAGRFGVLLGEPDEGHLRVAVDAPRHGSVVHRDARLAEDLLHDEDRLGETDVGQLRRRHEVARRVDALGARAHPLVDPHETPLVHLDPRPLPEEVVGERAPADRDDDRVDHDRLALAEAHGRAVAARLVAVHGYAGVDGDPPLLERAHDDVGDVAVAAREQLRERLEHRHLHAEVRHHRGELAADGAPADDGGRARERRQREHLVGGHDVLAVGLEAGDEPRHRPGRQHDVAAGEPCRRAVGEGDLDDLAGKELPGPLEDLVLPLLHQPREPAVQLVDHLVLAVLADGEVDGRLARLHAELLRAGNGAVDLGRLEELLGRDAAAVKAGAAHLLLLDDGDREAGRTCVERGGVPGGPPTDDDDVEGLFARGFSCSSVRIEI